MDCDCDIDPFTIVKFRSMHDGAEKDTGPVWAQKDDPRRTALGTLLRKRGEILSTGGGVKPLPATIEVNSRQGDLADQASGNNEVHIQLKLKQTDAKILQAIEEALYRMEKATYGICRDCGEEIAPARLNAIPWTRVCITCKEKQST